MALTKLNTYSLADDAITSAKIADDAITSALIADDAITSALIADNAVVTAAIADDAVTSAKTTVSAPNPNLIINGDMAIAQRATSSVGTGPKTCDRWYATWTGGGITQSQVALTSGGAYDEGHRHAFKMAVTSTNSANNRYAQIRYMPEAKDIRNFGWQYTSSSSYITVSFWVKSSLAGTYFFSMYGPDSSTAQVYATPFTLSAATWTKVTKTIPGGSNIVLNDDTGIGFYIDIRMDLGTDYTASDATINAWNDRVTSDAKTTTDFAQSWFNTANATWELTGVKLEVGQTATTFEKPDYTTELQRCQRYWWTIRGDEGQDYSNNYGLLFQWGSSRFSGWNPFWTVHFPVEMRVIPTTTMLGTWGTSNAGSWSIAGYKTKMSAGIGFSGTTETAGAYAHFNSTDDAITFDAEM